MYAIIKYGGKQHKVEVGDIIEVDKMEGSLKENITLGNVIAYNDGKELNTDTSSFSVEASIVVHDRAKKVIIFKKRRRKDSRVKRGFRRSFTKIKITKINSK
jgi:large subunit ribosomal protein L21